MSKLVEQLERLTQKRAQPMGFAAAAARKEKLRPILVIGTLAPDETQPVTLAPQENADALLFSIASFERDKTRLQEAASQAGPLPWGVRAKGLGAEDISQLQEMGCDFLIFGYEQTSATVFRHEELGKLLDASLAWPEGLLRTLSGMPLDGLFVADETPFTVQGLLSLERLARFADRPLMVFPPATVSASDLELLHDSGVKGLLVNLTAPGAQERLVQLREAIGKMETEPRKGKEHLEAVLPRLAPGPAEVREEIEEEEEEEEI